MRNTLTLTCLACTVFLSDGFAQKAPPCGILPGALSSNKTKLNPDGLIAKSWYSCSSLYLVAPPRFSSSLLLPQLALRSSVDTLYTFLNFVCVCVCFSGSVFRSSVHVCASVKVFVRACVYNIHVRVSVYHALVALDLLSSVSRKCVRKSAHCQAPSDFSQLSRLSVFFGFSFVGESHPTCTRLS